MVHIDAELASRTNHSSGLKVGFDDPLRAVRPMPITDALLIPSSSCLARHVALQCKWNTSGSILSVAGTPRQVLEGSREVSSINFYDAYGKFIRTLKVRLQDTILFNSPGHIFFTSIWREAVEC